MKEFLMLPRVYYLLVIIIGGLVTLGLFIDDYYSTAFPQDEINKIERETDELQRHLNSPSD